MRAALCEGRGSVWGGNVVCEGSVGGGSVCGGAVCMRVALCEGRGRGNV